MSDQYAQANPRNIIAPGLRHYAVTPANEDLEIRPRAIWVLTDGDLVIRDEGGVDVTYPVFAGTLIRFRAVQIRTGTTASVVAWY